MTSAASRSTSIDLVVGQCYDHQRTCEKVVLHDDIETTQNDQWTFVKLCIVTWRDLIDE